MTNSFESPLINACKITWPNPIKARPINLSSSNLTAATDVNVVYIPVYIISGTICIMLYNARKVLQDSNLYLIV